MRDKPSVLLIEDSEPIATLYVEYLKDELITISHVATGKEAIEFIQKNTPDLILLDLKLPDMNGQEILSWIKQEGIPSSTIVVTGHGSIDVAVDVMQIGAADFLEKPIDAYRLKTSVRNQLEKSRLQNMLDDFKNSFEREKYHGFIGSSLPMQSVIRRQLLWPHGDN